MFEFIGITALVCLVFTGLYRFICGGAPPCERYTVQRYENYDWFDKELEKEPEERPALAGTCGDTAAPVNREK